jgi:AraC-like DNA-binding protein
MHGLHAMRAHGRLVHAARPAVENRVTARPSAVAAGTAPSVLASWARAVVRTLEARGLDGRALAAEAGIDAARLDDPEARCPLSATRALWRRAVEATGDPCLGLSVSRYVTYATFHALGAAVLASGTLREAFGRLGRYGRVISDAAVQRLEDRGDRVRCVLDVRAAVRPPDEAIDALLSLQLRVARLLCDDRGLRPLRVELERVEPEPSEPFRRFFKAPIAFGARANALELARDVVDARLPAGNAEVARRIDEVLARYVARLDDQQMLSRLRAIVVERLPNGVPSQATAARALGVSTRTLQRRLAEAAASYQGIVDEARVALARAYLDEGWSVTETAFTLGFADVSSFSRAFRRWTGAPPSAHGRRRPVPPS